MKILAPLTAVLALAAASAFPLPGMAQAQGVSGPTVQGNARADAFAGRSIVNVNGEAVGRIDTVLIDEAGQVRHLIVLPAAGGARVALDPGSLTARPDGQGYVTTIRRDELGLLPPYTTPTPSGVLYIDRAAVPREYAPIVARPVFELPEARERIAAHGYRSVTNLTRDEQLTWWADAVAPDGRAVRVALDSSGTVSVR